MLGRRKLMFAAALSWAVTLAAAPMARAQKVEDREGLRVGVLSTGVKFEQRRPAEEMARVMDASVARLFDRAGYAVISLPGGPTEGYLSDPQLAEIGRTAGVDWVVYPKILAVGPQRNAVAAPDPGTTPGTFAAMYARVVEVVPPGTPDRTSKTVYMRQVGHTWSTPVEDPGAYGKLTAIPEGVVHLFSQFRPLTERLTARGFPSMDDPIVATSALWSESQVAGARESTPGQANPAPANPAPAKESPGKRVPVIDRESGKQLGFARVVGPSKELDRVRAVALMRRTNAEVGIPVHAFVPVTSADIRAAEPIKGLRVTQLEGVQLEPDGIEKTSFVR